MKKFSSFTCQLKAWSILLAMCGFANAVQAQNRCASLSCDCDVLQKATLRDVCQHQEDKIRDACRHIGDASGIYCLAHGPGATQLPLDLKLAGAKAVVEARVPKLREQIAALYWSVHHDLPVLINQLEDPDIENASRRSIVIGNNLDSLFSIQQQVSLSMDASESPSARQDMWQDFAGDSLIMAENIFRAGKQTWLQSYNQMKGVSPKKKNLGMTLIGQSGKAYEHAAHGFAMAGKHGSSAKAWKRAAEASGFLISIQSKGAKDTAELTRLKYQRAARLHRASFHWMKSGGDNAEDSLKKGREAIEGDGESLG